MKYVSVFFLLFLSLFGCSSPSPRAPVSDLTLDKKRIQTSSSANKPFSANNQKKYKVKAGDTLYAIAWKKGVDVKALAHINKLKSPYLIYHGDILNLPPRKLASSRQGTDANPKTKNSSQKTTKKTSSYCTAQKCNKNSDKKLVHEKTKAYSAQKADGKVANKAIKNKNTSKKVTRWRWPTKGRLTKTFSLSEAGMKGISLTAQRGAAINAAASGQVVYAGSGLRGYGNLIIIKHNYDYLSAYAHNETLLVSENDNVKVGQKIATMGDSGTESVHLHFEIRYRGKSVDPARYLPKR